MLEIKNIHVFYDAIEALKNVSININKGEIVTLIGANGAGKTTLLMAISGIVPIKNGNIIFKSNNITNLKPSKIVARGISQVPEGRHIFQKLTVMENLELGAFNRKYKTEIKKDIEFIFGLFPILKNRIKQTGGTLSGGEQQMLAIGRSLMAKPELLLLDEPSLGLAPVVEQTIFKTIKEINEKEKTTILLVEQNAHLALSIANRGYVIETGKIVLSDIAQNLLNNKLVKDAYLGE
jgi:branched-chain amino acid transport system ATP-binding protein